ncbi:MAG: hypothetical protein FWD47_12260 [Treponema sp.]|nr:hypothetical protein [Treponema sp.]
MRKVFLILSLSLFGLLQPIYAQTSGDEASRDLMRSTFIQTINNMEPRVVRAFFFYVTENASLVSPEVLRNVRDLVNQTNDDSVHAVVIDVLSSLLAETADSFAKQSEGYWGFILLANMFTRL